MVVAGSLSCRLGHGKQEQWCHPKWSNLSTHMTSLLRDYMAQIKSKWWMKNENVHWAHLHPVVALAGMLTKLSCRSVEGKPVLMIQFLTSFRFPTVGLQVCVLLEHHASPGTSAPPHACCSHLATDRSLRAPHTHQDNASDMMRQM